MTDPSPGPSRPLRPLDTFSSSLDNPSTLLRTPSNSSLTSKKARARNRPRPSGPDDVQIHLAQSQSHSNLSHLHDHNLHNLSDDDYPPSTSILKEAIMSMPVLTRQTTYSSLPPSPRYEAALDFGMDLQEIRSGQEIPLDTLEQALGELRRRRRLQKGKQRQNSEEEEDDAAELEMEGERNVEESREEGMFEMDQEDGFRASTPASSDTSEDRHDNEVDEIEDTFWPARSRRQTLDNGGEGIPRMSRRTTGLGGLNIDMRGQGGDLPMSMEMEEGMEGMSMVDDPPGMEAYSPDSKGQDHHFASSDRVDGGDVKEERVVRASLWDILKDEAGEEVWDGWVADGKWERISNFLAVPLAVEKVTLFGALLCLDGFLYNFTILPIRALFALYRYIKTSISLKDWSKPLPPSHIHSIIRLLLLVIPTSILLVATDASKMYHSVRGQDTIKLYVIFNALEIADRLCGAFGQDVLDTLFAKETLSPTQRKSGKGRKRQRARPYFFFTLSLGYVLAHTLIFFYMLVSLNVAINSYDYTLLSLLISNQFVEIKGSVFKKFERENLFQIMCADIVERFQLSLMLTVIAIRNMIEMSGSDIAFLPKSFMRGKSLVDTIFSPVLIVILSEMVVDWLKHAFITKFNHVRASVYGRFTDVLAKDVLIAGSLISNSGPKRQRHPILLDQSPLVARRLGFASIPLACLVLRVSAQAFGMLTMSPHEHDSPHVGSHAWAWGTLKWTAIVGVGISAWGCLVGLKILLGLGLLSYSSLRQAGMDGVEKEDEVNEFGRKPVGESKGESEYNRANSVYLDNSLDDLTLSQTLNLPKSQHQISPKTKQEEEGYLTPRIDESGKILSEKSPHRGGEMKSGAGAGRVGGAGGGRKGKKWKLEEVERWTMVKRIW